MYAWLLLFPWLRCVLMILGAPDSYYNVVSKMSRMTLYASKRSRRGSERSTSKRREVWKISIRSWWSRREIMMERRSDSIRGLKRSRERFVDSDHWYEDVNGTATYSHLLIFRCELWLKIFTGRLRGVKWDSRGLRTKLVRYDSFVIPISIIK